MEDPMSWFQKFGGSQDKIGKDKFVLLLNGILRPLQNSAVEQINLALRYIPDHDSKGRIMLLFMHVCLASILHKLDSGDGSSREMSNAFKTFAISKWDRPPGMNIDSVHKLFAYTRQEVENKLAVSDDRSIKDVGLTLLSMAQPNQEQFSLDASIACGKAAYACWRQAALETDKTLGTSL